MIKKTTKPATKKAEKTTKSTPITINQWLKRSPAKSEITEIDGIKMLLIHVVEDKLDRLTDQQWSTQNYQSKYVSIGNKIHISASLELVLPYCPDGKIMITRTLTGAITYKIGYFGSNEHHDNTAKSICIVNAASELGNQFGRGLNPPQQPVIYGGKQINPSDNTLEVNGKKAVKLKPDFTIIEKYQKALIENDTVELQTLRSIYNLN